MQAQVGLASAAIQSVSLQRSPFHPIMSAALFEALYITPVAFQWIHFTPHGVVPGGLSLHALGWRSAT